METETIPASAKNPEPLAPRFRAFLGTKKLPPISKNTSSESKPPPGGFLTEKRSLYFTRLMRESGCSSLHVHKDEAITQDHGDYNQALKSIKKIVDDCGLAILIGPRGPGKTQAMIEMTKHICRKVILHHVLRVFDECPIGPIYMKTRQMEQAVLEAQDLHTLPKLFRQWAIAPLLCLDELGELSGTDFARKNLTQLIDDRYGNRQPTLLAGNVSVSDIPGLIGLSAFDRLREVGGVIEFNWQSFRGMF